MHIITIAFGHNLTCHAQVSLLILSLLHDMKENDALIVYTDDPDYFKAFKSRIIIEKLTEGAIEDWMGPHRYIWRIKIKAIEHTIDKYGQTDILFLDSDTMLINNLDRIRRAADEGNFVSFP